MSLVDTFAEFKDGTNIDRPTMLRILEDVFRTLIRKKFGSDDNFEVIVNPEEGDLELWRVREIVPDGEVNDDQRQISHSEAMKIEDDYEIGEDCYELLTIESFGRRAILAASQTLSSRIKDLEKDEKIKRYDKRTGDLIIGEVAQVIKGDLLVLDDATGHELLMPRREMIRGDFYHKGDTVKGIIKEVTMINNNPVVILSRTDNRFLQNLLAQEVPEIEDGLITIRRIERIPGDRAKVAVESYDDRIDPVGACVGMKGSRIHGIVRELKNENIDIINYTDNVQLFIQRALTPAKITNIELDHEEKRALVFLQPDQVSLAIGKGGSNIRLASAITGYDIDVKREEIEIEIEDVDLDEFKDEIDEWIIDEFKSIGLDTAKSVLSHSVDELVRRTDLEEETILAVIILLEEEFEEDSDSTSSSRYEEE